MMKNRSLYWTTTETITVKIHDKIDSDIWLRYSNKNDIWFRYSNKTDLGFDYFAFATVMAPVFNQLLRITK